ncbi:DDE-type integrase/transposase/recombinase [Streptococcus dysgalactiae]|uniref:DDE-type integrase/transposase/recombinase n=1 Tax=Streptococcus dysgalactiae TaxID=1334 RepID=UPI003D78B7AE
MQTWGIDIFGPLPTSNAGNRYVVVMIEHFTRWVEAVPVADQTAETLSRVLMENVISRFGIPEEVLTDQSPCFEAQHFQDFLRRFGIRRIRTSPYHPQTNRMTERFNRTLKQLLHAHRADWEKGLPEVLFGYRTSKHWTTQSVPFDMVYGREARTLLDVGITQRDDWQLLPRERLGQERVAVRNTERVQPRNKAAYDQRDLVKVKDHSRPEVQGAGAGKFRKKWTGPYRVIQRRQHNFLIYRGNKSRWVNGQQLARWYTQGNTLKEGASEGGLGSTEPRVRIQTSKRCAPPDTDRCDLKLGRDRTGRRDLEPGQNGLGSVTRTGSKAAGNGGGPFTPEPM